MTRLAARIVFATLFVASFLYVCRHVPHRAWDPDEFEHLQFAWLVHQGQLPYRDFFEHHTPFYHFLMSAVFFVVAPANGPGIAAILLIFRGFSVAISAVSLLLTYRLARLIAGRLGAAFAALLLLSDSFFIDTGVEIRPDPLALLLVLVAVSALLAALAPCCAPRRGLLWAGVCGAALSLAILTTQKTLFAVPGVLLVAGAAAARPGARRHVAWCAGVALTAGLAVALMVCWPFLAQGAMPVFLADNLVRNAGWPRDFGWVIRYAKVALEQDTLFVLLALAGLPWLLVTWWRGGRAPARLAPAAMLLSLGLGLFILPVVYRQYLLLALPFAAIAGGVVLQAVSQNAGRWRHGLVAGALALVTGTLALNLHRSLATEVGVSPSGDDVVVRAKLACLTRLPPDATIAGAWSPGMAFRLPAFRYFFLHSEIQRIISPAEYRLLAMQLADGEIDPAVIDMDQAMRQMPAPVVAYFDAHYVKMGVGTLMRRADSHLSCEAAAAPRG
jgi:4-amino-4-deoxy-L-arabinose transferase-like glycosyltransferase